MLESILKNINLAERGRTQAADFLPAMRSRETAQQALRCKRDPGRHHFGKARRTNALPEVQSQGVLNRLGRGIQINDDTRGYAMLTKEEMQDLQDRISFVFPEELEFFVSFMTRKAERRSRLHRSTHLSRWWPLYAADSKSSTPKATSVIDGDAPN
jgi:hypothetical protein